MSQDFPSGLAVAPGSIAASELEGAVDKASSALMRQQQADGHFVFELEADATIPWLTVIKLGSFTFKLNYVSA